MSNNRNNAQLSFMMYELERINQELHVLTLTNHEPESKEDFEFLNDVYTKVSRVESFRRAYLASSMSEQKNGGLRHIHINCHNPLINTLSVSESNLAELETELHAAKKSVADSLEEARRQNLDEQLEKSQVALEKWHQTDHNVLAQIYMEYEQRALKQMAALSKQDNDHLKQVIHSLKQDLDEKSTAEFTQKWSESPIKQEVYAEKANFFTKK